MELGVNINPVAFLVVQGENVKLLPVNHSSCVDKLLDYIPDVMEKAGCMVNKMMNKQQEKEKNKDLNYNTNKDQDLNIKEETEIPETNINIEYTKIEEKNH